jgi:hypothetical protein
LPWLRSASACTVQAAWRVGIEHAQVGHAAFHQLAHAGLQRAQGVPSTRAGSLVTAASARCSGTPLSCAPLERQRQQQLQPGGAGLGLGKGQGLGVFVHRVWSDTSASMVPSASAARSASRSRCWRSGGVRRARLSKKPMSTSVRCSELMLTSAVTLQAFGLGAAQQLDAGSAGQAAQVHAGAGGLEQLENGVQRNGLGRHGHARQAQARGQRAAGGHALAQCISCGRSHTV